MESPVITLGKDGRRCLLFYGPHRINGCCSNFYESEFTYGSKTFKNVEQLFQYMKANTFGDLEKMDEILEAGTPAEAKRLGRKVSGFNRMRWDENKANIMYLGVLEKFNQNVRLRQWLKSVEVDIIAECSPTDLVWGTGFSVDDTRAAVPELWPGENLLGKTLMRVKERL